MKKWRRSERIGAIIKRLGDKPLCLVSLSDFAKEFNCAKSTISEDLIVVREILGELDIGIIETVSGAAGGVRYRPFVGEEKARKLVDDLCSHLSDSGRILPGGYLYMTDCIYSPALMNQLGEIFAAHFVDDNPDVVVTVETKGIPLAMATAHFLNIPVVVARRDSRVTEGSSVSINYVSGSSRRIQTMSLARRAMHKGARVLIIDDFMKAGGTVRGIKDLMAEFDAEVVGTGVLLSTREPVHKLVNGYFALAVLDEVDEREQEIMVRPADIFLN